MCAERELSEQKNKVEALSLELKSNNELLALKQKECEENACQSTSYYNALEVSDKCTHKK